LYGDPEGKRPLGRPDVGRRILLKWMLIETIQEGAEPVQLT
jgi:hypothetical protein